jgi:hypothetical protein
MGPFMSTSFTNGRDTGNDLLTGEQVGPGPRC